MTHLGIIIPTNQPTEFFSVMHDTLVHLSPMLKQIRVSLLMTFQPPWTKTQMQQVEARCAFLGLGFRSVFYRHKKGSTARMAHLRNAAAELLPQANWYMLADDNLRFMAHGTPCYAGGSAERYLQVIHYLNAFVNCGTVMCEGSLGGAAARLSIRPTKVGLIATARGLFFRNMGVPLYTTQECALLGSLEETYPAFRMMAQGMFVAKQFNNPTRHLHRHSFRDVGLPPTHITNYAHVIKPNGERYVREVYDDPHWTHNGRYFPNAVWEAYKANAGDMAAFHRPSWYWRDYHDPC